MEESHERSTRESDETESSHEEESLSEEEEDEEFDSADHEESSEPFFQEVEQDSGEDLEMPPAFANPLKSIEARSMSGRFSLGVKRSLGAHFYPRHMVKRVIPHRNSDPIFVTKFSQNGKVLLAGGQGNKLNFFNGETLTPLFSVSPNDVGWSIVDCDYSPDQVWCGYSSWSSRIWVANLVTREQECFEMSPPGGWRCCFFSFRFSPNSLSVIGGCNDGHVYLYDIESRQRTNRSLGHSDDVNAVEWFDETSRLFASGSDDGLVNLWDVRLMGQERGGKVGTLAGNRAGVTFLNAKGDGVHLLSQGKDQCIRVFDIRTMASGDLPPVESTFDYRGRIPSRIAPRKDKIDHTVLKLKGHLVAYTLIRAYFSPLHTTGQRYIISGSSCGDAFLYDAQTGAIVDTLRGHSSVVRELSWHPTLPRLVTASYDGSIALWQAAKAH